MIRRDLYGRVCKATLACTADHVGTVPGWGHQGIRSAIAVSGEAGWGSAPALRRAETGLGVWWV